MKTYSDYKTQVEKYLRAKRKSFKIDIAKKDTKDLEEKIKELEHIKRILNPANTYFEKMGFDVLLFDISNYSEFNFNLINNRILPSSYKWEMNVT